MANLDLIKYIKNQLRDGVAEADIRRAILGAGWSLAELETAWQEIKSEEQKPEDNVDSVQNFVTEPKMKADTGVVNQSDEDESLDEPDLKNKTYSNPGNDTWAKMEKEDYKHSKPWWVWLFIGFGLLIFIGVVSAAGWWYWQKQNDSLSFWDLMAEVGDNQTNLESWSTNSYLEIKMNSQDVDSMLDESLTEVQDMLGAGFSMNLGNLEISDLTDDDVEWLRSLLTAYDFSGFTLLVDTDTNQGRVRLKGVVSPDWNLDNDLVDSLLLAEAEPESLAAKIQAELVDLGFDSDNQSPAEWLNGLMTAWQIELVLADKDMYFRLLEWPETVETLATDRLSTSTVDVLLNSWIEVDQIPVDIVRVREMDINSQIEYLIDNISEELAFLGIEINLDKLQSSQESFISSESLIIENLTNTAVANIDGQPMYHFKVGLDKDNLLSWLEEEAERYLTSEKVEIFKRKKLEITDNLESLSDFSYAVWIDQEEKLIKQMTLTGKLILPDLDSEINVDYQQNFSDWNQVEEIRVPVDSVNIKELSSLLFGDLSDNNENLPLPVEDEMFSN
ncbi:MAG: hypothetical protein ACOCU8_02560 [Patescibacteria group bacterium]